jgi:methylmalonyl-CoA mutase N-terminal domain/subunit
MRQYSGYGSAEETNKRYKLLLEKGQTGLSVAFDLPTQMGLDSDDEKALGEVGKTGVAISTIEDMEKLFEGIPLDKVSVSMTINATAGIILAMYIACAKKMGISTSVLSGTVQNDILKEYVARGCYIYPPEPSLKLTIDIFEYCLENIPLWNFISVSGYHIREAGANAAQELGFTIANAICYLEEAQKRGLDLNNVGQRISFFLSLHNNFFEEIAKLRAGRRLWATITRDRFGIKQPKSWLFRVHCQTAGSTLTYQQPENNLVRVTYQALAGILGGVQSLHTNAMDEALALPTEKSATLALRTQQIIAYESGIPDVIDPLGGSFYLEELTDKLETQAKRYIEEIDKIGGAVKAIESGFYTKEIEKSAIEYQKGVEEGKITVVGVNKFVDEERPKPREYLKLDETIQQRQIQRVRDFKKRRDSSSVGKGIDNLKKAIEHNTNLIDSIIVCVKAGVTIGEINNVLRERYGNYR